MKERHKNHLAACKTGGSVASSKVYYCEKCDKVGTGGRMIAFHLDRDCKGKFTRPLVKTDEKKRHLIDQAIANTQAHLAKRAKERQYQMTQQIKRQMIADIEAVRQARRDAMEAILAIGMRKPE